MISFKELAIFAPLPYPSSEPGDVDGLPETALGLKEGPATGWKDGHRRGFGEVSIRLFDIQLRDINVVLYSHEVLIEVAESEGGMVMSDPFFGRESVSGEICSGVGNAASADLERPGC